MTTALLRCSPLWLWVVAVGCGTRTLDANDGSGGSGGGTVIVDGGAGSDSAPDTRLDVGSDVRDVRVLDLIGGAMCGDGILDPGEECEDHNSTPGDGCSPICQIECFSSCGGCGTAGPCVVESVCGNGLLTRPEACDDANSVGGDGCAAGCGAIEPGWRCPVVGRRCVPICGDGLLVGPETCDDRNTTSGDGCSDVCIVEPSTARCGDGLISGAEECDEGRANSDEVHRTCTTGCRFGSFCGDGIINALLEECDNGSTGNTMTYGNKDGCAAGCKYPHYCGDASVDFEEGEQCDFGPFNGTVHRPCTIDCKMWLD